MSLKKYNVFMNKGFLIFIKNMRTKKFTCQWYVDSDNCLMSTIDIRFLHFFHFINVNIWW